MKALYVFIRGLCIILWFRIKNGTKPKSIVNTQTVEVTAHMKSQIRSQSQFSEPIKKYRFTLFDGIIQVEKFNLYNAEWEDYKDFYEGKHYENIFR